MSRVPRLVAFAALGAIAAAAALWLASTRSPLAPSGPAAQPGPDATGAPAADADAAPATRNAVAPPAAAPSAAPAARTLVRGRCLAAEDDTPLAATLYVGGDDGAPDGEPGALPGQAMASVAASGDGSFACTVPLAVASDLRLYVAAPDRAPVGCRRVAVAPGTTWDLGDLRLVRCARVRGEVVDTTGAAVADAEVALRMLGQDRPALAFREIHTATTDARGTFTFAAVAAGGWYIAVERTGALRTPRKTQVPPGGEHVVQIEVERPDPALAIRGKVVDGAGAGLPGIDLAAYGEGARGRAVSGADGTFVLPKGPPHFDRGQPGVELSATGDGLEQAATAPGPNVAWGQHGVLVVMRPLRELVVRALDARGAALWPFAVVVGRVTSNGAAWQPLPARRQRAGADHVVLTHLTSGPHTLLLRAPDPALALAGPIPFAVDAASPRELAVRVPDRTEVQVDVRDEAGQAVPRCTLELVASLTARAPDAAAPAAEFAAAMASADRLPMQLAIATAATDGEGHATLAAPPGTWLLRATCRTHLPASRTVDVGTGPSRHQLVLPAATVVRGRLVPADALPALGLLERAPERHLAVVARAGKSDLARAEVAADGTFELGPLPPGVATLRLATWLTASEAHRGVVPHTLGDVDGTGAGPVDREYDVRAFVPATATGVVVWDGAPLRHGQFFLRRWLPEPLNHVRVATDGDGRFRTLVPPGQLGVQLAIPSEPGPGHVILPLAERWRIAAGQTLDLRVAAQPRRLRLRVLRPDGTPLGNTRVRLESPDGYNRPGALPTDARGGVDLSLAPYGTFTVLAKDGGGRDLASAPCTVGPDTEAGVVDVHLAAPSR